MHDINKKPFKGRGTFFCASACVPVYVCVPFAMNSLHVSATH